MIFETQRARTSSGQTPARVRPQLQPKCACGGTPGPTGECVECKRKRLSLQTKLAVNQPGDQYEQEADRVAEAVVGGATSHRLSISSLGNGAVQREDPPKPKSDEEKYKEAAKKVGEAFLETPPGKEITKKAEELGDAFISTLPGKIITGAAVTGAVATLAATHKELPIGIPEIPLDKIRPGLKMKITYEGPVDKPTKVMATFSIPLGREKAREKKSALSESEKFRAETARMAADQAKFREGLKTEEEKAAEKRMFDGYLRSKILSPQQLTPRSSPLSFGAAGGQLGFNPGLAPAAERGHLGPWAPDFKLTGETASGEKPVEPAKREEETLQRKATANHEVSSAPPLVEETLRSPGQPLDPSTRTFMEQRFGYDFGHVRVHADARAAESARAVDALAYTSGHHVVFAAGNYQQSTSAGQRLLAHELAHTIQQSAGGTPLSSSAPHRAPERTTARGEKSAGTAPAAFAAGTIQRQPAPPPITPTDASVCRIHFEHARTEFTDAKEFDRCLKAARGYLKGNPATQVALYGYASEEGDTKFNEDLAQRRAATVQKLLGLGGLPRGRILAFGRGEDKTLPTLPENRRVEVVPFQKVDIPEDKITVPKPVQPTHFCGPNVTKPVGDSVAKIKTDFRKLSADEKKTSCDWLRDEVYGLISWDVRPLHQQSWIKNDYGETCAQPLGSEGVCCHRSVQIGDACHYAGSVNYVSFGAMCRECFDHYATAPVDLSGVYNFREQSMVDLIELYKGGHLPFTSRASNVENSKKWASAGYQGWPSGGSPPKADCAECAPCPTQYVGKEFDARWCPYIDPKKACPENRAQVLKEESRDARSRRGKR